MCGQLYWLRPVYCGIGFESPAGVNDAETCRTAGGTGTTIVVPAGTSYSGTAQALTLPQTAGDTSTNFIVIISSTPPTSGQTLGAHGIQDNLPESTQPGIRNPGLNGSALSYQLGTTVTSIPSGAFTLANGTNTNTSAYDDLAELFTLVCTSASCNGVNTAVADANGVAPHHFAIIGAEIKPLAGLATPNAPVKIGQGNETAASQLPTHIHLAYDYLHGDYGDAPVSGGVATGGPTGANSLPAGVSFAGCIYCSISYSYFDGMIRPGAEGHAIYLGLAQQIKLVHNWVEGESIGAFSGGYGVNVTIPNFIDAQDVEERASRYTYPYSWNLAYAAGYCVNNLSCSGNSYVRKNSHETKVANRYLYDGNINENVDNSGAQSGIALSWKTDNCSNSVLCSNYWIVNQNTTITNTVLRNACQAGSWGFRATNQANGGGVTLPTQLSVWRNNLSYNISLSNPGCSTVSPIMGFRVSNNDGTPWAATPLRDSAGLTTTLTLTSSAGFTQSDTNVGDPIQVYGCADTSFNTTATAMGPPALSGTSPTGLTVVYSNPGTANATTAGCTFSNLQGYPQYLVYDHNSDFITTTSAYNSPEFVHSTGSIYPMARNMRFTNNLTVGGGISGLYSEGTRVQARQMDPATEIVHDDIFAGRTMSNYTQYSDASVPSTPPTTLYGPTSYCTGNDPTVENCIGIVGAMNQHSFPPTLNDWHQYRLCHAGDAVCNGKASPYAARQSFQSSDGVDLGINPTSIDAAQVSTTYFCHSPCGSPGPYTDYPLTPTEDIAQPFIPSVN